MHPPIAPVRPLWEKIVIWAAAALILLPWLFLSSSDFLGYGRAFALAAAACYAGYVFPKGWAGLDGGFRTLIVALLVVHGSTLCGGLLNHHRQAPAEASIALSGLAGILGFAALLLLVDPPWKRKPLKLVSRITGIALICVLLIWLLPTARHLLADPTTRQPDPTLEMILSRFSQPTFFNDALTSLAGLAGVGGLAVLLSLLLAPPWKERILKVALWLLGILLACSLAAYFIPVEKYIQMGPSAMYFDSSRLVMIVPTRLATQWMGQIAWAHANHAALVFGTAAIFILEHLAGKTDGRRWPWWCFGTALCIAVFLTGSRTGWLMILSALPFVLIRRSPQLLLKTVLAAAVVFALGMAALKTKLTLIEKQAAATHTQVVIPPGGDFHMSGLLERGSTGRTAGYKILWNELEGSRLFGEGWSMAGKPVVHLYHEHSSFLASLRAGGLVAMAAHFVIVGIAFIAAGKLYLEGLRWPFLLWVLMMASHLIDRSNVFLVTGNYEFIFHWFAVLSPLLIASKMERITRETSLAE